MFSSKKISISNFYPTSDKPDNCHHLFGLIETYFYAFNNNNCLQPTRAFKRLIRCISILSSLYWLQLAFVKMKTAIQLKKFVLLPYEVIWFVYCVISIVVPVLIWRRLAKLNSILDL